MENPRFFFKETSEIEHQRVEFARINKMPECFKFHSANIDVCGMRRFCRVLRKNWFSKSKTLKLLVHRELDEFCFSSIYPKSGAKSRECD